MYSLGIEEELFIIDPQTFNLLSFPDAALFKLLGKSAKHEFLDCQVEINSPICNDIKALKRSLDRIHQALYKKASQKNVKLLSSSTHPFASWKQCIPTQTIRYQKLEHDQQFAFRRLLACSVQFHVGLPNPELRFPIINTLHQFLPHLLALSTSSPFWEGEDTGLMSYRTLVIGNLSRSGLPPFFQSMTDFQHYIDVLMQTNTIINGKEIWWDVRPHPFYPTIECRICDNPNSPEDTIALAALFQALVAKSHKMILNGVIPSQCQQLIHQENKWRAARYGLKGTFIDIEKEVVIDVKTAIYNMLEWIDDVVDELGSRHEINHIYTIMEKGTSADRQLAIYKETGSLEAVIRDIVWRQL